MPGTSFNGLLLSPNEEMQKLGEHLSEHVSVMAGEIGERNYIQRSNLEKKRQIILRNSFA